MDPSVQHVKLRGELGVVYRQMNRLADAQRAFEMEYNMAKQIGYEHGLCRAVGNLGMVNYQLFQDRHDELLLDLAIERLLERIQRAKRIKENPHVDRGSKFHQITLPTIWESIGLSRLSLCYSARGKMQEAITSALGSLNLNSSAEDSTVLAMSRFCYGRVLLLAGDTDEAMTQFNPRNTCTPAMALCKEPSDEHRGYLQELVAAGADVGLVDDHGYTALDYAVFCNDTATENLVLDGLRRTLDGDVEQKLVQRLAEARLRKGYREIFQEKLRPVLLDKRSRDETLRDLRRVYARTLAVDEEKGKMFDRLKIIRYDDFLRYGKLPRSRDGIVQEVVDGYGAAADFVVIFFSYRWINKASGTTSPDDAENTQYRRMVEAIEQFLESHPLVDRDKLGLWVDFTCVDQDNPMPGVSALPVIIAQCNVVISLLDDKYHTRAWCFVEAMMVQTLRRSYGLHLWYEQVLVLSDEKIEGGGKKWVLQEAPMDLEISLAEKQLSFEEDRPKVLFLERQSKLLG